MGEAEGVDLIDVDVGMKTARCTMAIAPGQARALGTVHDRTLLPGCAGAGRKRWARRRMGTSWTWTWAPRLP